MPRARPLGALRCWGQLRLCRFRPCLSTRQLQPWGSLYFLPFLLRAWAWPSVNPKTTERPSCSTPLQSPQDPPSPPGLPVGQGNSRAFGGSGMRQAGAPQVPEGPWVPGLDLREAPALAPHKLRGLRIMEQGNPQLRMWTTYHSWLWQLSMGVGPIRTWRGWVHRNAALETMEMLPLLHPKYPGTLKHHLYQTLVLVQLAPPRMAYH